MICIRHIIKYAYDTTVVGLIKDDNETYYKEAVELFMEWCTNNLLLNVDNAKVINLRKK